MSDCGCGKTGWETKSEANAVVVEAKIKRALCNNRKRREDHSYRCPKGSGLWHVTSLPEQSPNRGVA